MELKKLIELEIDKVSQDNLEELYNVILEFNKGKTKKKQGILSRLKKVKIQAPEDFAEQLTSTS